MLLLPLFLALAQQPTPTPQLSQLPVARTDTSPFRRLELPSPTLVREGSGRPGPAYWQQRADYTIAVSLDTATHTIAGRETIRYTNRSPDTLRYIWFQLDQNIFRDDSRGALLNPPDARFAARGFIVAGTGRLTNPLEVLTAQQRARLARALHSDSTVAIIAKNEVGQPSARPAGAAGAILTWRFSAH